MHCANGFGGILGILFLFTLGCGFSPPRGRWEFPTTNISGVVAMGQLPVSSGWIEIHPVGETIGLAVMTRIRPDGTFHFSHAPVGRVLVRIELPRNYTHPVWTRFRQRQLQFPMERITAKGVSWRFDLERESIPTLAP